MSNLEFSKSANSLNKKVQKQISKSLFEEFKARKAAEDQALVEENKMVSNAVYQAYGVKAAKDRERRNQLNEAFTYVDNARVTGLTAVLTETVKASLLLDLDEYKAINEGYEDFIKTTIKSFLEKADLNANIENKNTLNILEFVEKNIPDKSVGIYLNEAQMYDEFGNKSYETCEADINDISYDVMDRVAQLVDNDRSSVEAVNDNLNAITAMDESSSIGVIKNVKPNKTILEVLAYNEAKEMISEGKGYNSDLALANAITYLTILETLDSTGLVTVGKQGYRNILEAAGQTEQAKAIVRTAKPMVLTERHEEELTEKVNVFSKAVSDSRATNFTSFAEWKANKAKMTITEDAPAVSATYDYENKYGEKMNKEDIKKDLEKQGFDFEVDDFDTICRSYGYRKLNK